MVVKSYLIEGTFQWLPSYWTRKVLDREIEKWHHAAQKFSKLLQSRENLYEHMMKPEECVLFDNTRVSHARSGFEEEDVGKPR